MVKLPFLWAMMSQAIAGRLLCEVRVTDSASVSATCRYQKDRVKCVPGKKWVEKSGILGQRSGFLNPKATTNKFELFCHLFVLKTVPENGRQLKIEVCAAKTKPEMTDAERTSTLSQCDILLGQTGYGEARDWLNKLLSTSHTTVSRQLQSQAKNDSNNTKIWPWFPNGNGPFGGNGHQPDGADSDNNTSNTNNGSQPDGTDSDKESSNMKVTVGISLGLGIPILIVFIVLMVCLCRKKRPEVATDNTGSCADGFVPGKSTNPSPIVIFGGENELETISEAPELTLAGRKNLPDWNLKVEKDERFGMPLPMTKDAGQSHPDSYATLVTIEDTSSKEEDFSTS